jgi:hypothetical protein
MSTEANDPDPGMTRAAQKPLPGVIAGIGSIVAGVIGFGIPVVGILASCVGIWLGIKGIRQARAMNYRPSITFGIIGLSIDGLGIVFWVCVVCFESYR